MTNKQILAMVAQTIEQMKKDGVVTGTAEEKARLDRELVAVKGGIAIESAREKLAAANTMYTDFEKQKIKDIPPHYIREVEALLLEAASQFGEYARMLEKVGS